MRPKKVWYRRRKKAAAESPRITERQMVYLTALVVVVGFVQCFVSYFQWKTMKGQLQEMQSSSLQYDNLIQETHNMAVHGGKQADSAVLLAKASQQQILELSTLATAAISQTNVSKNQLDVMRKQLEMTDRPLIKVALEPISQLTFVDKNMHCSYRISIKNVGRSVATKVAWTAKTYFVNMNDPRDFFEGPVKAQKMLCRDNHFNIPGLFADGETILPGEELVNASDAGGSIEGHEYSQPHLNGKHIMPVLVGCVNYYFTSSDAHHQTAFGYLIENSRPGTPPGFEVGKTVPREDIAFNRALLGLRYTD